MGDTSFRRYLSIDNLLTLFGKTGRGVIWGVSAISTLSVHRIDWLG